MIEFSDKQKQSFIKDLHALMPYKEMSKKYGLGGQWNAWRMSIKLGFPNRYRRQLFKEKREALFVKIQKDLCVLPNFREYCRRNDLNYFNIMQQGLRVRKIACYTKARNKCRICGKPKQTKIKYRFNRLCSEHLAQYERTRHEGKLKTLRQRYKKMFVGKKLLIQEIGKSKI